MKDKNKYIEMSDVGEGQDHDIKAEPKRRHGEESSLLSDCPLSPEQLASLHRAALATSWLSVVFSLGTGVAAIALGITGNSQSLFGYGLDAALDSLSSVAVVWRFHGAAATVHNARKERIACIAIGWLFLVSALSLIVKGAVAVVDKTREQENVIEYEAFSLTCGLFSLGVAAAKIYIGRRLRSRALATDSIITLVGAVACFCGVAGLQIYLHDKPAWYMDDVFGMLLGGFLLIFGIKILYQSYKEEKGEDAEAFDLDK